MVMFWFLLIALVVGGRRGDSRRARRRRRTVRCRRSPPSGCRTRCRPTARWSAPTRRAYGFPLAARGYRMVDVDDVLDRLGAELAERDARIAELESALGGAQPTRARQRPDRPGGRLPVHGQGRGRHGGPEGTGDAVSDPAAPSRARTASPRCPWALSTADYVAYHDDEWGRPVHGDDALFERLCLEAFQSGLSWITILRRREGFRAAFAGFEIDTVADFTDADRDRLLADPGIIRNRAKIDATIANAPPRWRCVGAGRAGRADLVLRPRPAGPAPRPAPLADVPAVTPESTALAKALKKRGLRFVGPTTAYALMQACGLVNDHLADCAPAPLSGRAAATRGRRSQRPRILGRLLLVHERPHRDRVVRGRPGPHLELVLLVQRLGERVRRAP